MVEDLRPIYERFVLLDDNIGDLRNRSTSADQHIGGLMKAQAGLHRQLDRVVERLEKLEARLALPEQH
jgi:hypothetical protein